MIDIDFNKYEKFVYSNLDRDNVVEIINFLEQNGCTFVEELLEDYLDIFTFEYIEFVEKFKKLNDKYDNNLIEAISNDMNILEEFYN